MAKIDKMEEKAFEFLLAKLNQNDAA